MLEIIDSLQRVEESVYLVQELTNAETSKRLRTQLLSSQNINPLKINCTLANIIKQHL